MRAEYKNRVVDVVLDFYLSAAAGLKKLKDKVDVSRMGHPSFLMVLTGTDLGYTRKDGVIVCPLGCLKP